MKATNLNLLEELEKEELSDLKNIFHERRFTKGQIIFTPFQDENQAFIIAEGRVRVFLAYADKEFSLSILGLGELYSTHTECYVEALDDCRLLVADVKDIARFMADVPSLTRSMVRVLGRILKNSFSIIAGLAFKDINKRLIDYILYTAEQTYPDEKMPEIELGLTVEQLSGLMGASRQTVSTLLNSLEREELIRKTGRGRYLLLDMDSLREIAS